MARVIITLLLLLSPIVVTPTSESIPYQYFSVSGTINRIAGGDLGNYVVVLMIRHRYAPEAGFGIIGQRPYGFTSYVKGNWICLTDTLGQFKLTAEIKDRLGDGLGAQDSLAVGVMFPDQMIVQGEPFSVQSVQGVETNQSVKNDGIFCDSYSSYIAGYHYEYPEKTVTVP
jgi:hypothetical protein